jgi:hypothetical protein
MTTRPRSTRYLLLFSCALATLGLLIILASAPAAAQTYTVIHTFAAGGPQAGITVDAGGNLYGTTLGSLCPSDCGTVFKLEHKSEGWIFSQLYAFQGGSDSAFPQAEVVIGPDGALYGTTAGGEQGGCEQGCGTVFRLTPPPTFCASVSCPWTKTILHTFTNTLLMETGRLAGRSSSTSRATSTARPSTVATMAPELCSSSPGQMVVGRNPSFTALPG